MTKRSMSAADQMGAYLSRRSMYPIQAFSLKRSEKPSRIC